MAKPTSKPNPFKVERKDLTVSIRLTQDALDKLVALAEIEDITYNKYAEIVLGLHIQSEIEKGKLPTQKEIEKLIKIYIGKHPNSKINKTA